MTLKNAPEVEVSSDLLEAIRNYPVEREVEHCGQRWGAPPFSIYAACPHCGARVKLRSFSAGTELEDVFDAVMEWLSKPGASEAARLRQLELAASRDE